MKTIFTICSNNYLAQALVLAASAKEHQPHWHFIIGLVDRKDDRIQYQSFPCEIIEAAEVEQGIQSLAEKFSIVELNTCLKPAFFQYLFLQKGYEEVVYLDPDTCIYSRMQDLENCLTLQHFVLTPHILSPIELDGNSPRESLFLNYGLYNLGFLALKNSKPVMQFLHWWKERTYKLGYDRPADGLFTDQLWINLVPLYYSKVEILRHPGYNMAPWNLHERRLDQSFPFNVNNEFPLVFYHFSGFDPGKPAFHKDYTRYQPQQRADLQPLYQQYRQQLLEAQYAFYKTMPCYYAAVRSNFLQQQQTARQATERRLNSQLPLHRKMLRLVKRYIPAGFKNFALKLIKS